MSEGTYADYLALRKADPGPPADSHESGTRLYADGDGALRTIQSDGTDAPVGGGGSVPGTVLPTANPTGVTVDSTTYDDNIAGTGKLTTLVAPSDQGSLALAIEGDDFPRLIFSFDPTDYGVCMFGDGTYDPTNDGPFISLGSSKELQLFAATDQLSVGAPDNNIGPLTQVKSALKLAGGASIQSSIGDPNTSFGGQSYGGGTNDLCINTATDGTPLTYLYRCTTEGPVGTAVWTGIL